MAKDMLPPVAEEKKKEAPVINSTMELKSTHELWGGLELIPEGVDLYCTRNRPVDEGEPPATQHQDLYKYDEKGGAWTLVVYDVIPVSTTASVVSNVQGPLHAGLKGIPTTGQGVEIKPVYYYRADVTDSLGVTTMKLFRAYSLTERATEVPCGGMAPNFNTVLLMGKGRLAYQKNIVVNQDQLGPLKYPMATKSIDEDLYICHFKPTLFMLDPTTKQEKLVGVAHAPVRCVRALEGRKLSDNGGSVASDLPGYNGHLPEEPDPYHVYTYLASPDTRWYTDHMIDVMEITFKDHAILGRDFRGTIANPTANGGLFTPGSVIGIDGLPTLKSATTAISSSEVTASTNYYYEEASLGYGNVYKDNQVIPNRLYLTISKMITNLHLLEGISQRWRFGGWQSSWPPGYQPGDPLIQTWIDGTWVAVSNTGLAGWKPEIDFMYYAYTGATVIVFKEGTTLPASSGYIHYTATCINFVSGSTMATVSGTNNPVLPGSYETIFSAVINELKAGTHDGAILANPAVVEQRNVQGYPRESWGTYSGGLSWSSVGLYSFVVYRDLAVSKVVAECDPGTIQNFGTIISKANSGAYSSVYSLGAGGYDNTIRNSIDGTSFEAVLTDGTGVMNILGRSHTNMRLSTLKWVHSANNGETYTNVSTGMPTSLTSGVTAIATEFDIRRIGAKRTIVLLRRVHWFAQTLTPRSSSFNLVSLFPGLDVVSINHTNTGGKSFATTALSSYTYRVDPALWATGFANAPGHMIQLANDKIMIVQPGQFTITDQTETCIKQLEYTIPTVVHSFFVTKYPIQEIKKIEYESKYGDMTGEAKWYEIQKTFASINEKVPRRMNMDVADGHLPYWVDRLRITYTPKSDTNSVIYPKAGYEEFGGFEYPIFYATLVDYSAGTGTQAVLAPLPNEWANNQWVYSADTTKIHTVGADVDPATFAAVEAVPPLPPNYRPVEAFRDPSNFKFSNTLTYGKSMFARGGIPPYTWEAVGSLPEGLSFSSTGLLTGRIVDNGSYSVTVKVTDSSVPPVSSTLGLSIEVVD